MRRSRPSSSRMRSALAHVCLACPYSWLSVVMDGVGMPGARVPSEICRRSNAVRRTYALGSDSSLIDTLVPYSIGNIANRNASTLVEIRRGVNSALTSEIVRAGMASQSENPGQEMILYSWTALSGSSGSSVAMGITDDRGRAMRAGEESLGSGQAAVVIIEAVRPAMAPRTLAPCYVRTGVGWLGRYTHVGQVSWDRFFIPGDPPAPGRMDP